MRCQPAASLRVHQTTQYGPSLRLGPMQNFANCISAHYKHFFDNNVREQSTQNKLLNEAIHKKEVVCYNFHKTDSSLFTFWRYSMDPITLSRWQFGLTTVYHFLFVPLTLGMSWYVAFFQTRYYQTHDEVFHKMAKFWGKLFLINFAIGVVTGIVQEFQFGMNWSEYSRYVGDIFGAPLAIEALMAFFLESTFLGIWIFGEGKIPEKAHLAAIWLAAIGSNLSALWILLANGWMQHPVGYVINEVNGRAELVDFFALITNPKGWLFFWHTISVGFASASFFILGISA